MDPRAFSAHVTRDEELEAKLARSIDLPLAALRASLESLNESLPGENPLGGVIEEVLRLGTNVRELVDYTCPPPVRVDECSAMEITFSALRGLKPADRERVLIARVEANGRLRTDSSVLANALRRVVENALESASEQVLVTARRHEGETVFAVIDRSLEPLDLAHADAPFRSTKRNRLGLGLALTRRDVELVGGALEVRPGELGGTCVTIAVPDHGALRKAA